MLVKKGWSWQRALPSGTKLLLSNRHPLNSERYLDWGREVRTLSILLVHVSKGLISQREEKVFLPVPCGEIVGNGGSNEGVKFDFTL